LECRPGDEIVCIDEFHASPDGEGFSWATSHKFAVGERLRYVDARQDPYFKDRPNGWHVAFETMGGKRFSGTQSYFVTEECWQRIEQHFLQAAQGITTEPQEKAEE